MTHSPVPAPAPAPAPSRPSRHAALGRSGADRIARIRWFARVARGALDQHQLGVLTERLLAHLRTLHPISPSYSRFRMCIVELNQPMADAIADGLTRSPGLGTEVGRRAGRRGLLRAIDTYTPSCGEDFRRYAASVIAAEMYRLTERG
ncbi:hypothetical protein [Yinghuangia soli]|uniref:Uncharacterized protein n=1 Tax=Yinghuangia soli TaxID=2908204 RepID=A0AA41TXU1_9ACTN|nr:hypothetical protein [Yinghuangia soli]MCF2527188.1 hypothetical protein [Yinghuangia soli]